MSFQVISPDQYIAPPGPNIGTLISGMLQRVFQMQAQRRAEERLKLDTLGAFIKQAAEARQEQRQVRTEGQGELDKARAADVATIKGMVGESAEPVLAAGQEATSTSGGVGPPGPEEVRARLAARLGDLGAPIAKAMETMRPPTEGAPLVTGINLPETIDRATGARIPGRLIPLRFRQDIASEERGKRLDTGKSVILTQEMHDQLPAGFQSVWKVGDEIPRETVERVIPVPKQPETRTETSVDPLTGEPTTKTTVTRFGESRPSARGTTTPTPSGATAAPGPGKGELTGQAYLASLPPTAQEAVKGMLDYTIDPKAATSRNATRLKLAGMAKRVDPSFDMGLYERRNALQRDFNQGDTAKNLTSLNQLADHLGVLQESFDAEKNHDLPALNAFVNKAATMFGSDVVTNAQTARLAVAEEVARLMRGGVGTEGQAKAWEENFSVNGSPAQQQGSLKTTSALVRGRLGALRQRYKAGMGREAGFEKYLEPAARSLFEGAAAPQGGKSKVGRFTVEVVE